MRTAITLLTFALFAACGKHPGTYTAAGEATQDNAAGAALITEADALWDDRVDEAKLQAALEKYAAVHTADPSDRHALIRLTRGWYFWGDAFTQEKDTKVERWGTAIAYGAKCIALNGKVAEMINQGHKEKDAILHAVKEDTGCIYWTATSLGKWGKIQSLSKTLKHLPTVKAYVTKAEELDPTYYHYGPARYWAAYYSALPSFAGQDTDKSADYFEGAIDAAPYYLPTRVLRAEYWAVATQNLAQFDEDLSFVIGSDPDMKPEAEITPENTKDIEKAIALCEKRAELFDKDAIVAAAGNCTNKTVTKAAPEPAAEEATAATDDTGDADEADEKTLSKPEEGDDDGEEKTVSKPEDAEDDEKTVSKPDDE